MLLEPVSIEAAEGEEQPNDRKLLAELCAQLPKEHLAEVLKYPFCTGEAEQIVLATYLAPIVDDIDVRPIVTGVIVPLHGYALEVGAKAARDQSLPGHFSAGIGAGYDALKVF
jgi:hypothetical protein